MIRYIIILIVAWQLCIPKSFCQTVPVPPDEFQRTFGGLKKENSYQVIPTSDNGVFSLGSTESFGKGQSDIYLVKTDSSGNLQWAKSYGGMSDDYGTCIEKTKDNNYIIVGYTSSFSKDLSDICLIKINEKGDVLWSKVYGLDRSDYSTSVKCTSDGGFIIVGETINFISHEKNSDILVIKVDSKGVTEWSKILGGNGTDYAYSIQETKGGGYIIGGETNSYGSGNWDFYLIKLKKDGDIDWSKTYGDEGIDYGRYAIECPDGGLIIGGNTTNFNANGTDFCLIKTDKEGTVEWSKIYGGAGTDYLLSLKAFNETGFILVGYSDSPPSQSEDVCIMYFDYKGKAIWARLYGSENNDYGVSVSFTANKKELIIGGSTFGFGTKGQDVLLIKTPMKFRACPCNLNYFYPLLSKKVTVKSKSGHYQFDLHCNEENIQVIVTTTVSSEQSICNFPFYPYY